MRFLFWNTKGRDLVPNISRLAGLLGADVVFPAENQAAPATVVATLDAATGQAFRYVAAIGCRIKAYTSIPLVSMHVARVDATYMALRLATVNTGTVLVVGVHLPSKLRYSASTQRRFASDLAEEIRRLERAHDTAGTLLTVQRYSGSTPA